MEWFVLDRDPRHEGVNFKKFTIIAKQLILDTWLDPGRASAD